MYTVKLVFEDDIRKISLESVSISSLYDTIKSLYHELENVNLEQLNLYYLDDEKDKITIKYDYDLAEAMRFSQSHNSNILKIFIQKIGQSNSSGSNNNININPQATTSSQNLTPLIGVISNMTPMVSTIVQDPATLQQVSSLLPTLMPYLSPMISSMLGNMQNSPVNCAVFSNIPMSPTAPLSPVTPTPQFAEQSSASVDSIGTSASPVTTSVSTNTLVDAKDASTETVLSQFTQTTQTQQNSSHQTTQTQYAIPTTSSTQTQQQNPTHSSTQTNLNSASSTQTNQISQTSQTSQTSAQTSQTSQTSQSSETQTIDGVGQNAGSYDFLAGTRFGTLLDQLSELGFTDTQNCVKALVKHGGNLPLAVDELLLDQLLAD